MRTYRSENEWRELIAEQKRSGGSVAQFCLGRGIHPNLFYRKARGIRSAGRFVALPAGLRTGPAIEIRVGRVTVTIAGGFRDEELIRVLKCLGEACDA